MVKIPKYKVAAIIIRLKKQNPQHFCQKVKELLNDHTEEVLNKSVTVIKEDSADLQSI